MIARAVAIAQPDFGQKNCDLKRSKKRRKGEVHHQDEPLMTPRVGTGQREDALEEMASRMNELKIGFRPVLNVLS